MPRASQRKVDILIGRGLLTAEAIATELRKRLVREITRGRTKGKPIRAIVDLSRKILAEFEPVLAQNVSDTQLAAWVVGADEVAKKLPKGIIKQLTGGFEPPGAAIIGKETGKRFSRLRLPVIAKAIQDLHTRAIVTKDRFNQLDEALKRQAFTVARIESIDTLTRIRDSLERDIAEGTSLQSFRKRVEDDLGVSPIGSGHLENVYRTNTQAAFSGGHETIARHPVVRTVFPFAKISPIDDGRVRETHLSLATSGLNGTAYYWADDPIWQWATPPIDFQCRCGKVLATVRQAAHAGVKVAQQWLDTGVEPPHQSMLPNINWRPTPGFVGGGRFVA